jgi:uracil-DNA glycosylase
MQFGRKLWSEVLERAAPSLIICMGRLVTTELCRLMQAENQIAVPIGWGNVKAFAADFPGGRIVGLPHLSRYSVIGRQKSETALKSLFDRW